MKKTVINLGVIAILMFLIVGCARTTSEFDDAEAKHPLLRRAFSEERAGNKDQAVLSLKRALDKNPRIALAHLRIALLYDDHAEDYTQSIYHYQRYLELRPDTDKKDMILDRIREAKILFCANRTDWAAPMKADCRSVMEENARLKKELHQMRRNVAELSAGLAATSVTKLQKSDQSSADPYENIERIETMLERSQWTGSVYVVEEKDTLSRIAAKVYQNPANWKRIYDANRDILKNGPGVLKTGQELIIPE